jgi:DNA helicase-2/ATP-dependent DNA helicase PcrA
MTRQELDEIFALPTAAIIAPAGHGKTEMIVDMVDHSDGKQLLLTHTNAGVDALQKRLKRRNISKSKYAISTIAAFCIRWGMAYRNTATIDVTLSPYKSDSQAYYAQFYDGAKAIFHNEWAQKVLQSTYAGIIVDEYQDCLMVHHEMFQAISHYLPVRVLGDPLQGIFAFSSQSLVDWNNLDFPIIQINTYPWRWQKTNPTLGQYLNDVRSALLPTLSGQACTLTISPCNGNVRVIHPQSFNAYSLLGEFKQYKSVLHITKWEYQQKSFSSKMSGIFQIDERMDCDDLFKFAEAFSSKTGVALLLSAIDFESKCATKITTELSSYISRLQKQSFDFNRIKKNQEFGQLLIDLQNCEKFEVLLRLFNWFERNSKFSFYRKELQREMIRSIKYARDHDCSIYDAASHIRKDSSLQKHYDDFKYLSSRTLLSKGLEFDCVIVDTSIPLTAKEFYVALTRAMKKVYILSPSNTLTFIP